jgi:ligand-binding sensor domain-containing protein
MKMFGRHRWRNVIAVSLTLVVASAAFVYWQTGRALRSAAVEVRSAGELGLSIRRISPVNSDFEWISAPAAFSGAAVFKGEFFLCGASGLFEYDAHGTLLKHYRPGQELPSSPLLRITAGVLKDAKTPELLMVTANQGVLAFNGTDFRQILPVDADARTVTSILLLGSGELLLGTHKRGVLIYDGQKLRPFHPRLSGLQVTELAGNEGDLWVGTQDRGVMHWIAGRVETFGEAEGMPDPQVFSIALGNDRAYVGTAAGIAEFDGGRFVRVLAPKLFARALYSVGPALLVGTGDGITEIDPEARRLNGLLRPPERSVGGVQQIFSAGNTLYAVAPTGLYQREARHDDWQRVLLSRDGTLLADRNISALALDSSSRLWVGYFDRGLDIFEPGLRSVRHIEDDNLFCINRIVPNASEGAMDVATANGLVLFDQFGRKLQVLGRRDGLLADHVTDAAPYGTGMVLATAAGLTFLDASGPHSLYAFHGLVNNHVYTVAAHGREVIAGTLGGISVLENENVAANYTVTTHGLTHNWISAVVRAGDDWIVGTYGGGIMRMLSDGRFEALDIATAKFEVYPNAMLATDQHVLAGTLGKGLYSLNRSTNRWTVITDGLPSLTVTALSAGNGYIYVGTDNGLVRIPEHNLP